jgi:glycine cleavage system regulatory protein
VKEEYPAISFYVSGDDRPGIIGRYARRIADAGVNIERTYLASGSRLAFVTDDNGKARAAIRA